MRRLFQRAGDHAELLHTRPIHHIDDGNDPAIRNVLVGF
jgi:hypothetical protein